MSGALPSPAPLRPPLLAFGLLLGGATLCAQSGSETGTIRHSGPVRSVMDGEAGKPRVNEPAALCFDLEFEHRLTNKTKGGLEGICVYVPVPEDCYQQKVSDLVWLRDGRPERVAMQRDQYGQPVATFYSQRLSAGGSLVVGFRCRAELRQPPKAVLPEITGAGDEPAAIPAEVRAAYTKDAPIYDLTSASIRKKAHELAAGCKNMAEKVRAIYDFVAQDVKYVRQGGWDPAPEVLARKSGSCSEFSYLFSSLCRANGIPTRFVGATIFRPGDAGKGPYVDKVWHRWVQVYLPRAGWVHMDPTRDRGKVAKHEFFGRQPGPALVLSHQGGNSRFLGDHYVSADNQLSNRVKRVRRFSWTPLAVKKTVQGTRKPGGKE